MVRRIDRQRVDFCRDVIDARAFRCYIKRMSNVLARQARDAKAQARWEARRKAKYAAQAADPAFIARMRAEGAGEARRNYPTGTEPDNVWTRQDPFAQAWRDETTRLMQERLCAE
jgi:hypothetical protein